MASLAACPSTVGDKYSEDLLRASSGPFARELLGFICGDFLGSGITREVFRYAPDEKWVVKVELDENAHFQNVLEHQLWDRIQFTVHARWFAPCRHISPCGRILLQRYAQPLAAIALPAEVPVFFTDLKPGNWGRIGKQPVAVDYGKTLIMERGMSSRMRRAHWT